MLPAKKIINTSFISALIIFCGLAIPFYGLYNYSLGLPTWSFNPWLLLDTIGFIAAGVTLAYITEIRKSKRTYYLLNILMITVSIYAIMFGVEVIRVKHVIIRFEHYIGTEAKYIGIVSIVMGLIGTIWALFTKPPEKAKPSHSQVVICVNCLEPYSRQSVQKSLCPKCGGILEDLNGFYERHPDKQKN